jgi:tetratricopeptide (TPR) repeat protein
MLEMIGEYASERLAARGEEERLRRLHAEYYLALAEASEQALAGASQRLWIVRLEEEHDNLRAALGWALERGEDELALGMSGSLWKFWELHGHLREGRRWLGAALSAPSLGLDMPRTHAKALFAAGRLAERQGDNASAWVWLTESVRMAREHADKGLLALGLHNLANLATYEGDYAAARTFAEESLAIRKETGDLWGMANTLHNLGFQAEAVGEYAEAGGYFAQSLAISRELEDAWGTAYSLDALALIRLQQGDYVLANSLLEESLALRQELGDKSGIARSLERLARVAGKRGQSRRAARLYGAAGALREREDIPIMPVDRRVHEEGLAEAKAGLSEAEWSEAWGEGRHMTLEQAIEFASELTE